MINTTENSKSTTGGLLKKAKLLLEGITPSFDVWAKKAGFKIAGILAPFGDYYYLTESCGIKARGITFSISKKSFWNETLSKSSEWQCFSRTFNELPPFYSFFDEDIRDDIDSLYFLPFGDKENPYIFVAIEREIDDDLNVPQASECALKLKNIIEFKNNYERIFEKIDGSLDNGFEISSAQLFILSIKSAIDKAIGDIELESEEIKPKLIESITDKAMRIVSPLFREPNCCLSAKNGEIKVVLFAKDEPDEELLTYHISSTLNDFLGKENAKSINLLAAGICPNKKGTIAFLKQGL